MSYGGLVEIIEYGIFGYYIDFYYFDEVVEQIVVFFEKCKNEFGFWNKVFEVGL